MPPALGNPQGLWLLGLLGPLLLLYILRVRRERVRVASTWLWQAAARDMLARSPWQRLRRRLLLLLEILALLALGVALARPALSGARIDSEHVTQTARQLQQRIEERFPNSGLARVALTLEGVTREASTLAAAIEHTPAALRWGM